jgi:hypothetical protein
MRIVHRIASLYPFTRRVVMIESSQRNKRGWDVLFVDGLSELLQQFQTYCGSGFWCFSLREINVVLVHCQPCRLQQMRSLDRWCSAMNLRRTASRPCDHRQCSKITIAIADSPTLDKRPERRLTLGSFLLFDARSSKSSAAPPLLTLRLSILFLACTAPTPLSHLNNRTRNKFAPGLVDFIVTWDGWWVMATRLICAWRF